MPTSKRTTSTAVRKPRAKKTTAPAPAPAAEVAYPLTTPTGEPVSVVHLAAELAPFARTGGLGEAVANLALYQRRVGMETAVVMPLYRQVHDVANDLVPATEPYTVAVGPRQEQAQFFESASLRARVGEGKPRVFFVANGSYFDREGIYGDQHGDYADNAQRWSFFAMAALNGLPQVVKAPVLLHAHDWHTA
ncbi:MAG: glycogen/starch synthase, partial [Gemmatimonadaceae bacterium]